MASNSPRRRSKKGKSKKTGNKWEGLRDSARGIQGRKNKKKARKNLKIKNRHFNKYERFSLSKRKDSVSLPFANRNLIVNGHSPKVPGLPITCDACGDRKVKFTDKINNKRTCSQHRPAI